MPTYVTKSLYTVIACLTFMSGYKAHAQELVIDIPPTSHHDEQAPVIEGDDTHPSLTLSPDRSEIINLDEDAQSVIVGNPAHINVVADSARRLIVVPRAPGASYFTVLNKSGDIIMKRHILVASPKEKYLRVKRTCTDDECEKTSVFYCPDTCHEVILNTEGGQSSDAAASSEAAATQAASTASDPSEE